MTEIKPEQYQTLLKYWKIQIKGAKKYSVATISIEQGKLIEQALTILAQPREEMVERVAKALFESARMRTRTNWYSISQSARNYCLNNAQAAIAAMLGEER